MQQRKSKSSPRKTPTIGSAKPANNSRKPSDKGQPAANILQDTAANDRNLPVFDVDIFHEPPGFMQRIAVIYGAIFRRLVFFSIIMSVVGYFYPDSLSNFIATSQKKLVDLERYVSEYVNTNEGEGLSFPFAATAKLTAASLEADTRGSDDLPKGNDLEGSLKTETQTLRLEEDRRQEIKHIMNQVASELANADVKQQAQIQQKSTSVAEINKAMRDKFENRPLGRKLVTIASRNASIGTTSNTSRNLSIHRADSRQQSAQSESIPIGDIKRLLSRYSKSYIFGDADIIGELFLQPEDEQHRLAIDTLTMQYRDLFDNSSQRWIEFQDVSWRHSKNRAVGSGYIKSESTLNNQSRSTVTANIDIEVRRRNGQIRIARLHLTNKKTTISGTAQAGNETIPQKSPLYSSPPNQLELNGMIAQFVTAYERGNIEALDAMFSNDIISNTRSSKAEIRQDYENLFSSSQHREMAIDDLHWKFSEKHVKGVGSMKVVVISPSGRVRTVEGKIQFVAKKIANKVLITHLYHTEHSK